jgi:hypothetical protein
MSKRDPHGTQVKLRAINVYRRLLAERGHKKGILAEMSRDFGIPKSTLLSWVKGVAK